MCSSQAIYPVFETKWMNLQIISNVYTMDPSILIYEQQKEILNELLIYATVTEEGRVLNKKQGYFKGLAEVQ